MRHSETSRRNRGKLYAMAREVYLQVARNFKESRVIDEVEDVFYLTAEEVDELAAQESSHALDVKALIRLRRAEYRVYKALPAFTRLVFMDEEFNKKHQNVNGAPVSAQPKDAAAPAAARQENQAVGT